MHYLELAGLQGNSQAQCYLGEMYEKGVGVMADPKAALALYEQALASKEGTTAVSNLKRFLYKILLISFYLFRRCCGRWGGCMRTDVG